MTEEQTSAPTPAPAPWFHYVIDALPALVFLAVLLITRDFRMATWWVLGSAVAALAVSLIVERRIRMRTAITCGLIVAFGGVSLALHDPAILKMKMTIVDGVLGVAVLGGLLIKKNPLKLLLGGAFHLPEKAWAALSIRYGLFFIACAVANEFVRRTQSDATWATFRVVALIAPVVFAVFQTPFLMKHSQTPGEVKTPGPPDMGF